MDMASRLDRGHGQDERGIDDRPFAAGDDERRMHVRAYNHWVSLLKDRPCPPLDELDPTSIADFGPNSVLLDFSAGLDDPGIAFLGSALREECELGHDIARIAQVPPRSLLSRLTAHYLQIIANRAPIGFEAEFVGRRGRATLYRGILMPFSSDGATIDYVHGVINWKEMVDDVTQASLAAELDAAVRATPPANDAPIWADGAGGASDDAERTARETATIPDRYEHARAELRDRTPMATVALAPGDGEFVVLIARTAPGDTLDIVARVDEAATVDAIVRRVA